MIERFIYRKDDPLRYLYVPRHKRLDTDGGPDSDALDGDTGADDDIDRDQVRNRGDVVSERDLE